MSEKTLITGPRGGTYWLDDKGVKHYVKGKKETPKPKVKTPEVKTYICYYKVVDENGYYVDDFKEWCKATSKLDAETEFRDRYAEEILSGRIEISQIV